MCQSLHKAWHNPAHRQGYRGFVTLAISWALVLHWAQVTDSWAFITPPPPPLPPGSVGPALADFCLTSPLSMLGRGLCCLLVVFSPLKTTLLSC